MKKSFTLIELIVVIAIIAILAAIIAPNAFKAIEKAKISQTIANSKSLKTALYSYYTDTGQWPPVESVGSYRLDNTSLITDDGSTSGWDGPYLERWSNKNAWGGLYEIRRENVTVEFVKPNDINILLVLNNIGPIGVPRDSALKIDTLIDDGNLSLLSNGDMVGSCVGPNCEDRINVATIDSR